MCDIRDTSCECTSLLLYVKEYQDNKFLDFLYHSFIGQKMMPFVTSKKVSSLMGHFYDSKFSKKLISSFISKNKIDMTLYKEKNYQSFNDFFTREKKQVSFPKDNQSFYAPCDAYLSAYPIDEKSIFKVKGLSYSLEELLQNRGMALKYKGGLLYVFRLIPTHYHRYHYFDDGKLLFAKKIPGIFHTVRDVALRKKQVYLENTREYSLLETKNFQDVLYMEVGALGVGKIKNHYQKEFTRGMEKGMFFFGGSTVLVLFSKDVLKKPQNLLSKSLNGYEAVVQCGQKIGEKDE